MYHWMISFPKKIAKIAVGPKNEPKGILVFKPFPLMPIRLIPIIEPNIEPAMIVKIANFQPKNAPIAAINFTSPIPIPGYFSTNSQNKAKANKIPLPITRPNNESIQLKGKRKIAAIKPAGIPPRLISFGII